MIFHAEGQPITTAVNFPLATYMTALPGLYPTQIDLVTVFDAILTSRQTCEKLQCLYENLMPNNFRKTKKIYQL